MSTPDSPARPVTQPSTTFHERLVPGPGAVAAALAAGVVAVAVVWPLHPGASYVVGALVAAAAVAALVLTAPVVEVAGGELRAGSAHVPLSLLGEPVALADRESMREELGPRLDARAYVVLRTWARTGVRVPLEDPADPTPYWLVSTRRPQELVRAVEAGRA
ncbi:DUF3093 domain-containing protein [Xylanimonas oleitrophica]|uniref:DUF3093 domain-containing protein n=1 Tax=Xylanimonas oleitrophica TaxID=2607479 RepID=A0A2W5WR70_9MICO|nr:DUF3093 domain-containing protein [Xylanimonas oleitrophica]PZR53817.1 DUF3093 domain-containing protein [Xylanimonas oleitrophica]